MRPLACVLLAIAATPARADGLLTDTMLHPMDGFTAYTLKQGEIIYNQSPLTLPLPSWAWVGVTDWLTVEIVSVPITEPCACTRRRAPPSSTTSRSPTTTRWLAYRYRLAPWYASRHAVLRTMRFEFPALVMYHPESHTGYRWYVPIIAYVYWQWGG